MDVLQKAFSMKADFIKNVSAISSAAAASSISFLVLLEADDAKHEPSDYFQRDRVDLFLSA